MDCLRRCLPAGAKVEEIGRRLLFGSKSQCGTEVASTFCSLIETAKLHGVDPTARAADRDVILLPWQLTASAD